MPVNKDELAKDLATPEYQEIVKTTLATHKFSVMTEVEKNTLLENHKAEVIEKEMKPEVQRIHSQYDQDFKTIFGDDYKRNDNEKTYEAVKRVGTAKLKTLSDKITELEGQIKKGDTSGVLSKKLEEAENLYKTELEKRESKIKELETGVVSATKQTAFTEAYGKIKAKFVKDLPKMFSQTEKMINTSLLTNAILKDGVLYVGDGSGAIKKDSSFKEITVESALEAEYKDVIDTRRKQGGTGSGSGTGKDRADDKTDPTQITVENFEIPGNIKDPGELMDHLLELGIPRGTKPFKDIWNKYVDAKTNTLRQVK